MVEIQKSFEDLKGLLTNSKALKMVAKNFQMLYYGSTVNGLIMRESSDLDICLLIEAGTSQYGKVIETIQRELDSNKQRYKIIYAKEISAGWILKAIDKRYELDVEI